MVEDALKSARNIHRFILAVSLVSLVFALSIELPANLTDLRKRIAELKEIPFDDYETFALKAAKEFSSKKLSSDASDLEKYFESSGLMIFELSKLSDALQTPVHIGRILTKSIVFVDVDGATLESMDAVSSVLDIKKNTNFVRIDVNDLIKELDQFFASNPCNGCRIDGVRMEIENYDFDIDSFFPGNTSPIVSVYFELRKTGINVGAPVFNASFRSTTIDVPNSSWIKWFQKLKVSDKVVKISKNGKMAWLPGMDNPPKGYRQKKIGLLLSDVEESLKERSPSSQTVSILGTNVPGILVVYATPLILLALLFYFFNHISQLKTLARNHRDFFESFAWFPVLVNKTWPFEFLFTTLVLPVASITILNFRILPFNASHSFEITLSVISSILIILLSIFSFRHMLSIRKDLGR